MTDFTELQAAQRATDASLAALNRMLMECAAKPFPPVTVTQEDKLRGAILEACLMLREGAPGRALEILESSLKL